MKLLFFFFLWNLFFPLFCQKVFYIDPKFNDSSVEGSFDKPFSDLRYIYNISNINEDNVAILLGDIICNSTLNNVFGLTIMYYIF